MEARRPEIVEDSTAKSTAASQGNAEGEVGDDRRKKRKVGDVDVVTKSRRPRR